MNENRIEVAKEINEIKDNKLHMYHQCNLIVNNEIVSTFILETHSPYINSNIVSDKSELCFKSEERRFIKMLKAFSKTLNKKIKITGIKLND